MSISLNEDKAAVEEAAVAEETVADAPAEARAEATAVAAAVEEDLDLSILGRDSGKLAYLGAIVDPTQKDVKTINKEEVQGHVVVGYRFLVLEDLSVPDFGLGKDARQNRNSFNQIKFTKVKKGQVAYLTVFETGVLMAAPEFNGVINGVAKYEGKKVGMSITAVYGAVKNGGSVDGINGLGTISIRATEKGQTTYINPEPAFEATLQTVDAEGKKLATNRWERVPFTQGPLAKFAPLTITGKRASGEASPAGPARSSRAASFLAQVKNLG